MTAQVEVRGLIQMLKLPLDERGRRRRRPRSEWFSAREPPDAHDLPEG